MKVVVQRVSNAQVAVNNEIVSKIGNGLLLLVGFTNTDGDKQIEYMARKISRLRIFEDENHLLNKSILDTQGEILSISQFTVYGDALNGNRPSFIKALNYVEANILYQKFNVLLRKETKLTVLEGVFGENMEVTLTNSGPVTLIIEKE